MPYIAYNDSEGERVFRDDIGKRVIPPGGSMVIAGNQHWKGAVAMGFRVEWVEARDMGAAVEDGVSEAIVEGDVGDHEEVVEVTVDKPKRKAKVEVRED